MAFAVIHSLVPAIIVDRFVKARTKKHTPALLLLASAFGGLLPDADFMLEIILPPLGVNSYLLRHGGITHTLLFVFALLVLGIILMGIKRDFAPYAFVLSFGSLCHLALDAAIGGGRFGGLLLLYPFSSHLFELPVHLPPDLLMMAALDGVFLGLWLTYLVVTKKLKEFG